MSGFISNYWGNQIIEDYLRTNVVYLALHNADPTVLNDAGTEFAGNGYTRQPVTFTAPGAKTTGQADEVRFSALPDDTLAWYGVHTALSGGNLLFAVPRPTPLVVASDEEHIVPVADIALTL